MSPTCSAQPTSLAPRPPRPCSFQLQLEWGLHMRACSRHTLASDTHSGHTTDTGTARPSGQGLTTRHKGHTSHSTGGAGTQ